MKNRKQKAVKLAASIAMNPHYHAYPDLGSSPHSPSPDNNNYPQLGPHHNGHGGGGGAPGNPMGVSQMDSQAAGFHGMGNGGPGGGPGGPVKHCGGCGGELKKSDIVRIIMKCLEMCSLIQNLKGTLYLQLV